LLAALVVFLLSPFAYADLRVFTCEPEWAALAEEIAPGQVETTSATTAFQDPHYIQARPSLISAVRRADLVVCSGAELEIGWLPVLLQKANNRKVMPGTPGFLEASSYVPRLGATATADRARGDIHPQGNPHVQTDPHNIARVANAMAERMADLDPGNASVYEAGLRSFIDRWQAAIARWETEAAPLKGLPIITHHKSWVYLERWLGLDEVANLERIPGMPPTVAHLGELVSRFKDGGASVIIRATYQDARASEWMSERTGIPAVVLPLTVGGTDEAKDLMSMFDDIVQRLLDAAHL
jgi:zinc/manganese transport system substrate-binding protein